MGGLSIIMFSGTVDKFIPLGVITQTAANMEMPVKIFVTGWALLGFVKDGYKNTNRISKEFEDMAPLLIDGLRNTHTPSWYEMIKSAKESGNVTIYACSMMANVMQLKKENFDDMVDNVVGAATFLQESKDSQVIFI